MVEHDTGPRNCPSDGGWCEGGFEILIGFLSFVFGVCILCYIFWCCYTKKRDQIENLEMIERQDKVIKTYQIAKKIISGTAFESLQLTILQTRIHFVCISEYVVMRCSESS